VTSLFLGRLGGQKSAVTPLSCPSTDVLPRHDVRPRMFSERTSHATARTACPAPSQHGLPPPAPPAATTSAEASSLFLWAPPARFWHDAVASRTAPAVRHFLAVAGHQSATTSVPVRVPFPALGGGSVARGAAEDAGMSVPPDSWVVRSDLTAAGFVSVAAAAAGSAGSAAAVSAMALVTRQIAAVISIVRGFLQRERTAGRVTGAAGPVARTARATGVGERTVERVSAHGCAEASPSGREAVARRSQRHVLPAELARIRDAVYAQYEHRSIPTLDSTLKYLCTQSVEMSWTDSPPTYTWSRTTLFRALREIGVSFSPGLNHNDVEREKLSFVAQKDSFLASIK